MARGFRSIRSDPLTFLAQTQGRYGDLVAFPVPGAPVLLLSDPQAVRHVLQVHARNWTKATRQYSSLAMVTGPGLLAVSDDRWLSRRRIAQPAFHHGRAGSIAGQVAGAAREVADSWADLGPGGQIVDVDALSMRITLDAVGRTLFDTDLADVAERLVHATDEAAELVVAQGRSLPRPSWMAGHLNRRLGKSVAALDGICRKLVTDRRARGTGEHDIDLLGLLVAAGLPDDAIRDELVTMVVAGHETVASALTWTLMLLAEHPEAQQRVRDEVRAASGDVRDGEGRDGEGRDGHGGDGDGGDGDGGDGGWTALRLRERLPWTRAVIDESLRLFPPGWVVSRRATEADSLGGQAVPAGTVVIISPWLLHRDSRLWSDPMEFRPERFLGETATTARPGYVPFGLGPRLCIGREFAIVELTVLLVELLRDHPVELPDRWKRPDCHAFVTLRPRGGLRLVVQAVPVP